jgi:hypothetical protein
MRPLEPQTSVESYLAVKSPWLRRQLRAPLERGDLPFVVGPALVAQEELPPLQPDLKLDGTAPLMHQDTKSAAKFGRRPARRRLSNDGGKQCFECSFASWRS